MEHATNARFTSTKCPPGQGLENSCELPFGFVWTPLAPPDDTALVSNPPVEEEEEEEEPEEEGEVSKDKPDEQAPTKHKKATSSPPQAVPDDALYSADLPPILCLTCLSYLNMYATIDAKAGQWKCPLCEALNVLPAGVVAEESIDEDTPTTTPPLEALVSSPTVELRQQIVGADTSVDATTVVLVLDEHLLTQDAHTIGRMMQTLWDETWLSLNNKCCLHLGLIVFGKNVNLYQLGVSGIASCDVTSSHRGLTEEHLQEKSYLRTIRGAADWECLWRCLAAQYGSSASSSPENDFSTSTTGDEENDGTTLNAAPSTAEPTSTTTTAASSRIQLLRERKEARLRKQQQQQAAAAAAAAPNSSSSSSARGETTAAAKSPWTVAVEEAPWSQRLRCTGEAVQCAIDLASMARADPRPRTARVLIFTNGCPSFGPGSAVVDPSSSTNSISKMHHGSSGTHAGITGAHHYQHHQAPYRVDSHQLACSKEYFDVIAKTAAEGGIGFDVLCTGAAELAIPAYQALVEPSSGYVVSQESFATQPQQLAQNLHHLMHRTYMAGIYAEETENMNWIDGCIVDLRMVGFVEPTHLVGTGEFFESEKSLLANERSAFEKGCIRAKQAGLKTQSLPVEEMIAGSLTRVRLGRYDSLSTFSVMLQLHDLLPEDEFAIFQCIARHVDQDGKTIVTRISTHRLAIAKDVSEFLDSVDEEVVPVILAKEAVYRSMFGREVDGVTTDATDQAQLERLAYDAQTDIDTTIQNISGAFRLVGLEEGMSRGMDLTAEGKHRTMGSSMDFAFPAELSGALRRLYHLRRGPLISPGPLQSMDDRAELRSLFVRLPLEQCLSMMAPSLWSSGPLDPDDDTVEGSLSETVPPETLALWSNCVVAADFYQGLFVWSGQETRGPSYDKTRQQFQKLLMEQSKDRFPMPTFHLVSEGDSMSRRFTSLLSPSHADPVQHQVAHFPALEKLSEEELTHLRSKFPFHDSNVDPSFRQWFWDVASAASKGRGVSLCE